MWIAARVKGIGGRAESRAATDLRRHGVEAFWPRQHRYFICRMQKQEKYRESALFPGYVFIRLQRPVDRDIVAGCYFLSHMLGSWTGGQFYPREIPGSYVTALIENGPVEINRQKTREPFKKGQKVRLVLGRIANIIAEVEGLDQTGKVVVKAVLLGGRRQIHVEHERLEAAE